MCYSNSSTSKNIELSKRYNKKIRSNLPESPIYFASGFSHPSWRIVTRDESLEWMQWGLIPSWFNGEDPTEISNLTLNSRIETADEKASFKHLFNRQNCIVPSNGFFEWKTREQKQKIPYFVFPVQDMFFSMAGLFDQWLDPKNGEIHKTFTILTGEANALMSEIHNTKKRMPILLLPEQENAWIDGNLTTETLLTPAPDSIMGAHEIDKHIIKSKRCNSPSVQEPFHNRFYEQGSLF
jgi:putative SOS response-associated peptidase YedK